MGLTIRTDGKPVPVYRQDKISKNGKAYVRYSIGVSSKDPSGKWINGFLDVEFMRGVSVSHKTKIDIEEAFYILSEYNGNITYKLKIKSFKVVEEGVNPNVDEDGFMTVPDDDETELLFK